MPWSRRRSLLALAALGSAALGCNASARTDDSREPGRAHTDDGSRSSGSLGSRPRAPELAPAPDHAATLRVLTFNVNFGVADDPHNVAAIAEADADLVLLQETTVDAEVALREALADRYPHLLFRECCRAGGLGVMSKHPIVEESYLEPRVGWFTAWRVVVDTPLGRVQALDVHLRPPMSDGGSWVAGYFSTRDVRREEMEDLFGQLDRSLPTIVAGDLNEDADGRAVAFLAEQGWHSALAQVQPRAKTWHWQTRMGKLHMMLDHVLYGPGLRLHHAEVLPRGVSDHFPVLVELSRADPTPP